MLPVSLVWLRRRMIADLFYWFVIFAEKHLLLDKAMNLAKHVWMQTSTVHPRLSRKTIDVANNQNSPRSLKHDNGSQDQPGCFLLQDNFTPVF